MAYSLHCSARSHPRLCPPPVLQTSAVQNGSLNWGWTWHSSLCWSSLKAGDAQQGLLMARHQFSRMWKKENHCLHAPFVWMMRQQRLPLRMVSEGYALRWPSSAGSNCPCCLAMSPCRAWSGDSLGQGQS